MSEKNTYACQFKDFFGIGEETSKNCALDKLLASEFPRKYDGTSGGFSTQEYLGFHIGTPIHNMEECLQYSCTYEASFTIQVRQTDFDRDGNILTKEVRTLEMTPIPLADKQGRFVLEGRIQEPFLQLKQGVGVTIPTNRKIAIKDIKGGNISFLLGTNSVFYVTINGIRIPYVTILRYLCGITNKKCKGTDEELIESFDLAYSVRTNKNDLREHVGEYLAYDVIHHWHEDFVNEDTGEIYQEIKKVTLFKRGAYIDEDFISLVLSVKSIMPKKIYTEGTNTCLLASICEDPTSDKYEALVYLHKALLGREVDLRKDYKRACKSVDAVLFPEIGVMGRASLDLLLKKNLRINSVEDINRFIAQQEKCLYCNRMLVNDYLNVIETLLSMQERKGYEARKDKCIKASEINKRPSDLTSCFSIFVKKDLERFRKVEDDHCMGLITYDELVNTIRPFSLFDGLLYTCIPLTYITEMDVPTYFSDDSLAYNFSAEKLLRYFGDDLRVKAIKVKEGTRAICNNAFQKLCAMGNTPHGGLGIDSIEFPESLEEIGKNAFWQCLFYGSVRFPESHTNIYRNAFVSSFFQQLYIPKNVRIEEDAFKLCYFNSLTVHSDHTELVAKGNVLYDKQEKQLSGYLPCIDETKD